jgi:hypothetical protein
LTPTVRQNARKKTTFRKVVARVAGDPRHQPVKYKYAAMIAAITRTEAATSIQLQLARDLARSESLIVPNVNPSSFSAGGAFVA